jgi:hypothetical protein
MKKAHYLIAILGLSAWTFAMGGFARPADEPVPRASSEKPGKADTNLRDEKGVDRDAYDLGFPPATAMRGNHKIQGVGGSRSLNERRAAITHPTVATHPPAFSHSKPAARNPVTAHELKPEKFGPAATRPFSAGRAATPRLAYQPRQMPATIGGPLFNTHNRGKNPAIIGGPLRYTARNSGGLSGSEIKPKP